MGAAALLQIALGFLPMIQVGVEDFITWLETLRAAAKQDGEWTAEHDDAFVAAVLAKKNDPAYQPHQ